MKITEIIVSAGRTFNHPYEQFSNLRPQVTYKATLEEGDDPDIATRDLQAKAEKSVEDHKQNTLQMLRELHYLSETQREAEDIERNLHRLSDRLKTIREENPKISLLGPVGNEKIVAEDMQFLGGRQYQAEPAKDGAMEEG